MIHRAFLAPALAAVGLCTITFVATPSVAADPSDVLARHKAYVGWAFGDGTLKSARSTIEADAPSPAPTAKPGATPDPLGLPNSMRVELRRELLYRTTGSRYGHESYSEGFTGSVFWAANPNGQTVTVRGRPARFSLSADLIDAEAFHEAPMSARPDAQFDGKTASVIRMEPKTGVVTDLYFGADGALLGATLAPDVPLEKSTVHIVSYAEFAPGKRYVSAWRYGDSKRTYKITKFEPNAVVSDADLHPPTPRPQWSFGEPRSVPVTVAEHGNGYTNTGSRAIHVEVAVNGKVGTFLLDSGAGTLLVYDPFAKAAGVRDIARTAYSGVNGQGVAASLAVVDTLRIGGNVLKDVLVTHGERGGMGIDGIIGFDVLAGAVFDVDLTTHRLTISDPNGYNIEPQPGAWAFTPDLSTFHIGVPMKVAGTVLQSVWLDTGDDFFIILPHELEKNTVALANEIKFSNGQTMEDTHYFGGVDGTSVEPVKCVRMNEVQIGPYRYQKALACFASNDAFGLDGGLVGYDFLRHFNWTFDYPHNRVVLTPNGA